MPLPLPPAPGDSLGAQPATTGEGDLSQQITDVLTRIRAVLGEHGYLTLANDFHIVIGRVLEERARYYACWKASNSLGAAPGESQNKKKATAQETQR